METTEKRIPEWAVKAADRFVEVCEDPNPLARLLVTVREKALREAANSLFEWANIPTGYLASIEEKILALADKDPS